ncbi:serine hydrolase domain-containing protein [Pedobacter gandavensis]|uniref:Serine hydrolase n=1 Tax=Pedobacter gandavensis TaxID=2679963 RepID=A0ABR6ERN6_9SPHI|nr:serine hydrolase domain-containing protein [Pedobacter gandavensis]MBB2147924.1 serine hydrolase [Pedobacter gandavensis]
MIKIPALSVLLCLFSLSITAQDSKTTLYQNITTALAKEKLAGAVWSTVDSLGNISTGASGVKNADTKQVLSTSDKVQVGSITKTLIATGIFRLVTMNKMSLDTPVEEILTNIKFKNPWSASHPVTVRHLLDHTAGLENLRLWQMFSEQVTPNTPLVENFSKHPSTLQIHSRPGTQFAYSNMGYTLLGMVIEAITRQRYEEYLDTYVLKPIGMAESTFGFVSQLGKNADPRLAMGHLDHMQTQPASPMYLRPAGQFTTTAYDMGIFLKFLMTNGNLRGYSFIRKDLLATMGNPDAETESKQHGLEAGYAAGLMKRDRHQVIGLAHAGSIVGYHAMIYLFPKEKKAFFISHNMDSETADYEVFNKILLESLNLKKQEPDPRAVMPVDIKNWAGNYVAVRDQFKMFAYVDLLAGFVTLIPGNDHLVFSQLQKEDKILKPTRYHLFKVDDKISSSHVIYTDSMQNRRITDGFKTYKKISSLYLWTMYMSLIFGLLGLSYLFVLGWVKLLSNRKRFLHQAIGVPFLCILALLLPIPLFMMQHFTALGDITAASIALALVTTLLPIGLLFGLWRSINIKKEERSNGLTSLALIFSIQWVGMLIYWGMAPMLLWI